MTSGRLVEYEGGGEETRSNPWLAELQQEMFVEINPKTAATAASATASVWVRRPPAHASRCRRWSPSAWRPTRCGCRSTSPAAGRAPTCWRTTRGRGAVVRGEAVNTATTYGYDSVTMMQETKTTICKSNA
jgi:formate dehydrogenase major subunit